MSRDKRVFRMVFAVILMLSLPGLLIAVGDANASYLVNYYNVYPVKLRQGEVGLASHHIYRVGQNNSLSYVPVYFRGQYYVMIYNYTWTGTSSTIYLLDSSGVRYRIKINVLPLQEESSAAIAFSGDNLYVAVSWFQYDPLTNTSSIYLREYCLAVEDDGETSILSASPVVGPVIMRGIPGSKWIGYGCVEDYLHVYVMYGYGMVLAYHERLHRLIALRHVVDPYSMPYTVRLVSLGDEYVIMNTTVAYTISENSIASHHIEPVEPLMRNERNMIVGTVPVKRINNGYVVALILLTPMDAGSRYELNVLSYRISSGQATYLGKIGLGITDNIAVSYIYLNDKLYLFYENSTQTNSTIIKLLSFPGETGRASIAGSMTLYNAFPYSFAVSTSTGNYIVVDALNGIYITDPDMQTIIYKPLINASPSTSVYFMEPIDIDNDGYTEVVYIETTHGPGGLDVWISYSPLSERTFTVLTPAPEPPVLPALLATIIVAYIYNTLWRKRDS